MGNEDYFVFLDPDICMVLEDDLPELIAQLVIGKVIELEFAESCWLIIKFVPIGHEIQCYLKEFGYSTEERLIILNKKQVLDELKRFLTL